MKLFNRKSRADLQREIACLKNEIEELRISHGGDDMMWRRDLIQKLESLHVDSDSIVILRYDAGWSMATINQVIKDAKQKFGYKYDSFLYLPSDAALDSISKEAAVRIAKGVINMSLGFTFQEHKT